MTQSNNKGDARSEIKKCKEVKVKFIHQKIDDRWK